MLHSQKSVARGCAQRRRSVEVSARAGTSARTPRGTPAMPSHLASTFSNASALKGKVALGNARMSRMVGGGVKAYKRVTPQMCGIIGIFKYTGAANVELYEGLLMLQHRGQDSAGMVTTDWNRFKEHKENGLVKDVFGKQDLMDSMKGVVSVARRWAALSSRGGTPTPCIFEYIYLARPDSVLNGIPVYNFQLKLGIALANRIRERGWDVDIVCPVPDGSRPAAIQIAAELGLPYREGLVKNRYVGRTFIMPDQRMREMSVRRKLNAMPAVFKDQSVLLIDDSIVRGTTMTQIVDMVRRAGAKKVYLASASPPVIYPNVYGVDMPSRKEFVANGLTIDQVREVLKADGLIYQTVEDLLISAQDLNPDIKDFDASCFTGEYITGDIDEAYLQKLELSGRGANRRATQQVSLINEASLMVSTA
ncbi:Amidophosphoribosyltransferase [Tetrabaena socialis]|uniref:Amidophosphoribosyltransferase n=1 Tax=Tetrabaena socialis TaxID=47790 RepID=A0A2J7ZQQ3_9CHLO|nr:Amidophosphoribosyltransferase [Tetrabaena socialis]|eukprot:PNH02602.1 Amidophosphoribosyltransferase [Tetrabaena socialis]